MYLSLYFTFLVFCHFTLNAQTELDAQKAFKQLKKYQGTWQSTQTDSIFIAKWHNADKNKLQIDIYDSAHPQGKLTGKSYFYYHKKVSFTHYKFLAYNIQSLDSDVIYPFQLDSMVGSTFTFSNFNNPFPNKIVFEFKNENNLMIQWISKDSSQVNTFNYQRIKK